MEFNLILVRKKTKKDQVAGKILTSERIYWHINEMIDKEFIIV